jgi:hypothetical protein
LTTVGFVHSESLFRVDLDWRVDHDPRNFAFQDGDRIVKRRRQPAVGLSELSSQCHIDAL